MKSIGFILLGIFYSIYIGKMLLQKRRGIQTDQIAKGKPKGKLFYTELLLKAATFFVIPAEVLSIFIITPPLPEPLTLCGILLGCLGNIVFGFAVITMKDSWRAGIAENDKTEMVTGGIYQISRNPAFLGFDLVYIGLLIMFFNWLLLLFSVFAIVMLHLQILQEEQYLPKVFGEKYILYCKQVRRYIGKRSTPL